jgi:hypothetical protein
MLNVHLRHSGGARGSCPIGHACQPGDRNDDQCPCPSLHLHGEFLSCACRGFISFDAVCAVKIIIRPIMINIYLFTAGPCANVTEQGYGRLHSPPVYRRLWRILGYGKRRERVWCGAAGQHHRVPAMGRGTCTGKRRGRGDGMGAEDGELWADMVRSDAVDCMGGEYTKAAREWRLGVRRGWVARASARRQGRLRGA